MKEWRQPFVGCHKTVAGIDVNACFKEAEALGIIQSPEEPRFFVWASGNWTDVLVAEDARPVLGGAMALFRVVAVVPSALARRLFGSV